MKVFLIVFGLITTGLSQDPTCSNQSDCPDDQCCVHNPITNLGIRSPIMKRFVFTKDVGHCRPQRKLNESCNAVLSHDLFNHDLYEHFCQCEKPLECRGETVIHHGPGSVQHINPKCQPKEID